MNAERILAESAPAVSEEREREIRHWHEHHYIDEDDVRPVVGDLLSLLDAARAERDAIKREWNEWVLREKHWIEERAVLKAEITRLRAEIGYAGSPPPGGSWMQRLQVAEDETKHLREREGRLVKALKDIETLAWGKDGMVSGLRGRIVERAAEARRAGLVELEEAFAAVEPKEGEHGEG